MSFNLPTVFQMLFDSSVFWLGFTVLAYLIAVRCYSASGGNPLLLPVLTAVAAVVATLMITGTPYASYAEHTKFLQFLIGPATVALAVPLFNQLDRLKALFAPVCVALLAGSATAILSAIGIAWLLGASAETAWSLAPKSATMPIAMDVSALNGGMPSLTTIAVAVTGIAGAMLAGAMLSLLRIKEPVVKGFALGLSAHAIGTARAFQVNDAAGAFAALGMGLNGIATAVLVPLIFAATALF